MRRRPRRAARRSLRHAPRTDDPRASAHLPQSRDQSRANTAAPHHRRLADASWIHLLVRSAARDSTAATDHGGRAQRAQEAGIGRFGRAYARRIAHCRVQLSMAPRPAGVMLGSESFVHATLLLMASQRDSSANLMSSPLPTVRSSLPLAVVLLFVNNKRIGERDCPTSARAPRHSARCVGVRTGGSSIRPTLRSHSVTFCPRPVDRDPSGTPRGAGCVR